MNSTDDNRPTDIIATVTVAIIDADGVYRGIDTIAADALTDKQVPVPADCDLAPGKYRWSAEHQRFDPLTELQQAPAGVPTLEAVVYRLVLHAQAQGATDPAFAAYATEFKKSFDGIGAVK